jgi:hypothetical protein
MSGHDKRVLPASAATTSALVPIPSGAFGGAAAGRSTANDDLIDQLVGGLVQSDPGQRTGSQYYANTGAYGAQDRIYSIDDEEIDEPPVPIPSTWRDKGGREEPSWIAEQLRASAYGFIIGLFVVIPAVMLLTGQAEKLPSWQVVSAYTNAAADKLGLGELFKQAVVPAPKEQTGTVAAERTTAAASQPATEAPTRLSASTTDAGAAATSQPAELPAASAVTQTQPTARTDGTKPTSGNAGSSATTAVQARAEEKRLNPAQPLANTKDKKVVPQPEVTTTATSVQAAGAATEQAGLLVNRQATGAVAAKKPIPAPETSAQPGSQMAVSSSTTYGADGTIEAAEAALQDQRAATAQQDLQAAGGQAVVARTTTPPPATEPEISMAAASRKIEEGDMGAARVMLARLASKGNSEAIFRLAETFDPNFLAANRAHGEEPNTEKARMFYSMALSQGVTKAKARIEALQ